MARGFPVLGQDEGGIPIPSFFRPDVDACGSERPDLQCDESRYCGGSGVGEPLAIEAW